jgi:hypothetical protein
MYVIMSFDGRFPDAGKNIPFKTYSEQDGEVSDNRRRLPSDDNRLLPSVYNRRRLYDLTTRGFLFISPTRCCLFISPG